MNYRKIYNQIIYKRRKNIIEKNETLYSELHHIKPKCFFKNESDANYPENLIRLTAREHFICHYLLSKLYKKRSNKWFKMNQAFMMMKCENKDNSVKRYFNSRLFEKRKEIYWKEKNKYYEKEGLKSINNICNFIDKYNKIPSTIGKIKNENKLGQKISYLRIIKHQDKGLFFNSYQILAEKRGYPNLFNSIEESILNDIKEICDWIDENNKIPSQSSNKGSIEFKFSTKLQTIKSGKNKNSTSIFYDSYQKLVEERGYPNLFNTLEENGLIKIKEICDWIDENKRNPKNNSKDKIEKSYAQYIQDLKNKRKNNKKYYQSYDVLFNERGYIELLLSLDEKYIIKIEKLCKWIDENNRNPKQCSKNKIEKELGNFLFNMRKKFIGKKGCGKWVEDFTLFLKENNKYYLLE